MKKNLKKVMTMFMVVMMLQAVVFAGPRGEDKVCCKKANMSKEYKDKTIAEAVSMNKRLEALNGAIEAAGLVETLQGEGPFTIFAPVNKAFQDLSKETVEALFKPENKEQLAGVLTYHVVPGKVTAKDVVKLDGQEVMTVNGKPVKITVKDDEVFVNGAKVITTDIMTKNGVIHLIDTVLIPE